MLKAYMFTGLAQGSKILVAFVTVKLIAMKLGPEGLGSLGNYMTLSSSLVTFAGGGILTAVVKYSAEFRESPGRLSSFMSSAFSYTSICASLIFLLAAFFSNKISAYIFGTSEYWYIIVFVFAAQIFYSYSNLILGFVNGSGNIRAYSMITVASSLIALPLAIFLIFNYGFIGVTVALILTNLLVFVAGMYYALKTKIFSGIKFLISKQEYLSLFKYSIMLISSAVFLPYAEIFVRTMIVDKINLLEAGYFQALLKLSMAYTSFISLFLAYYFMPQISATKNLKLIETIVYKYLKSIFLLFFAAAVIIYLFRIQLIHLALSEEFDKAGEYIIYLLIADLFKITGYVFGFVTVAKAKYRFYIAVELGQSVMVCVLTSLMMSIDASLVSVYKATIIANIICFFVTFAIFRYFIKTNFNSSEGTSDLVA